MESNQLLGISFFSKLEDHTEDCSKLSSWVIASRIPGKRPYRAMWTSLPIGEAFQMMNDVIMEMNNSAISVMT